MIELKRSLSLNSIKSIKILNKKEKEEEEEFELISLNQLEFINLNLNKNCLNLELKVNKLQNEIEIKIKEWDLILIQLKNLDKISQGLTDQIHSTIDSLKLTPLMQITASKTSTKNVKDRITSLKLNYELTLKQIQSSLKGLDNLESIMVEEEGTLAAEAKQSGNILVILYVFCSLATLALAWYFRNYLGIL